ncbi:MAG: pilus assembly protein PilP [Deltaproteobacteria bacterium]|nr:pilus assembly protein PilP [Deltaproteobacteria bacterium]
MNTTCSWKEMLAIACAWGIFSLVGGASCLAQAQGETVEDTYRYDPAGKRDPFLSPFTAATPELGTAEEQPKTPLQRFDLGQLKLVGVIWEASEPKALIEDSGGLGYIVTRGTLIGSKGGVIKTIEPKRVVVEEYQTDFYGKRQVQERELQLFVIDSSQGGATKKGK